MVKRKLIILKQSYDVNDILKEIDYWFKTDMFDVFPVEDLIKLKKRISNLNRPPLFVPVKKTDPTGVTYEDEKSPTYGEVFIPWTSIEKLKSKKGESE